MTLAIRAVLKGMEKKSAEFLAGAESSISTRRSSASCLRPPTCVMLRSRPRRAGDLDTVLGLMTEDVVFMVPGREPFGKEAFAAQSRGMAGARLEGTSDIRELRILGDWAFMRNHIAISVTPPGGKPQRRAAIA